MSLEQLQCPACSAPVSIAPGAGQATCAYCGVTLRVQRTAGENSLLLTEQVTDAIAATATQTSAAISENTAVTREELRRMQLSQELAGLEMRLATLQGETRALQRMPSSKVTTQQLRQLGQQETALQARIAEVQTALNPPAPAAVSPGGKGKPAKIRPAPGEAKKRGCFGWALLIVAWFIFWPFLLPWTMIRSPSKPIRIAGYVVAFIVALYLLLFLFAPRSPRTPTPQEKPAVTAPMPLPVSV